MDQGRLKRRVAGREEARAIAQLVSLDNKDAVDAFFDELRSILQPAEVLAEATENARKLSQLASTKLPRGEHAGRRLDDVPRRYLQWWIRDSEEWSDVIGAYLAATSHLYEGD